MYKDTRATRFGLRSLLISVFVLLSSAAYSEPPLSNELILHFDPSAEGKLQLDSQGRVIRLRSGTWFPEAGGATYLKQPDGNARPTWISSESGVFNGRSFMRFKGDDFLRWQTKNSNNVWVDTSYSADNGHEVLIVSRASAAQGPSFQGLIGWDQQNASGGTARIAILRAQGWEDGTVFAYPEGDVFHYQTKNNKPLISLMTVGARRFDPASGASQLLDHVDVAEILVYPRELTEDEREQVFVYLHQRYGIPADPANPTADLDARSFPLKALIPEDEKFLIGAAGNSEFFRHSDYWDFTDPQDANARHFPAIQSTIRQHYQLVVPTNNYKAEKLVPNMGKWDATMPHDFTTADKLAFWAMNESMKVKGHVLVWHKANPLPLEIRKWGNLVGGQIVEPWRGGSWNESQLRTLFNDHIHTTIRHFEDNYPGVLTHWDVVNEAIVPGGGWTPGDDWRTRIRRGSNGENIWFDGGDGPGGRPGLGDFYIDEAFHQAHAADMLDGNDDIALLYNDFSCSFDKEATDEKSDIIYAMVQDMIDRGVPIDGVGLQMHINLWEYDEAAFRANVRRFKDLTSVSGQPFEVHISELDVGIPGLPTAAKLNVQGAIYESITQVLLEEGADSLVTWGTTSNDLRSSVDNAANGFGMGLPFNTTPIIDPPTATPSGPTDPVYFHSHYAPNPAFFGMHDALAAHDWSGSQSSLEVGSLRVDHNWKAVSFGSAMSNTPVVILSPASQEGGQGVVAEIRNVTPEGFEARVAEWSVYNGPHLEVTLFYLAHDPEVKEIGGLQVVSDAISVETGGNWTTKGFWGKDRFEAGVKPVILATYERKPWFDETVALRIRNASYTGFEIRAQREEALQGNADGFRSLHYLAIEPGTTSVAGFDLKAFHAPSSVNGNYRPINFGGNFQLPSIFASPQSYFDGDTISLRHKNLSNSGVELRAQEETSSDAEVNHVFEDIGVLVIGN